MSDFQVGDRVRVHRNIGSYRAGQIGQVTTGGDDLYIRVALDGGEAPLYRENELERIDGQVDRTEGPAAIGGAGVPGSPTDNPLDQHAGQHPAGSGQTPVAPVAVATVEALTKRVAKLELLMHVQDEVNHNLLALFTVHERVHHTDDDND